MSETPLPKIDSPYDSPSGFTMWRPQFRHLRVQCLRDEVIVLVDQPGADVIVFALTLEQRDRLVSLLQQAPDCIAQAATETVAGGGANV